MIEAIQIKLIHIAKHQLLIDDDTYRSILLERYKVSSSTKLSKNQADSLLDFFKSKGFKQKKKKPTITQNGKIIHLATALQLSLIEVLKANIVWRKENGYQLWLTKRMRIKKVITKRDASKVIEGLKGMLGITSNIIMGRQLPFPVDITKLMPSNDEKDLVWFYDFKNKKLIGYSYNDQGVAFTLPIR